MASDDRQERARRPNSNNQFVLYGEPPVDHLATSVSFDGTNVLYTECATNKTACTTDIRPYTKIPSDFTVSSPSFDCGGRLAHP